MINFFQNLLRERRSKALARIARRFLLNGVIGLIRRLLRETGVRLVSVLQAAFAIIAGGVFLSPTTFAQDVQVPVSDEGIFYFIIIDDDTGDIAQQGTMDLGGIDRILLAPDSTFRILALFSKNLGVADETFTTPQAGLTFEIPSLAYFDIEDFDTDGDDLSDLREFIVGTNLFNTDTDTDGVNDGAEVLQGLNPLDGFIVETGIVAAGPTAGEANMICVLNNLAVVGNRSAGITVFDVKEGLNPLRIAQVDTPGEVMGVDEGLNLVAVADARALSNVCL